MEAEGDKEGSGANGWDFHECGVAAGLGSGGAAHWTVPRFLNVHPACHLALKCNCLMQM
jgi:hypothetical protein